MSSRQISLLRSVPTSFRAKPVGRAPSFSTEPFNGSVPSISSRLSYQDSKIIPPLVSRISYRSDAYRSSGPSPRPLALKKCGTICFSIPGNAALSPAKSGGVGMPYPFDSPFPMGAANQVLLCLLLSEFFTIFRIGIIYISDNLLGRYSCEGCRNSLRFYLLAALWCYP